MPIATRRLHTQNPSTQTEGQKKIRHERFLATSMLQYCMHHLRAITFDACAEQGCRHECKRSCNRQTHVVVSSATTVSRVQHQCGRVSRAVCQSLTWPQSSASSQGAITRSRGTTAPDTCHNQALSTVRGACARRPGKAGLGHRRPPWALAPCPGWASTGPVDQTS